MDYTAAAIVLFMVMIAANMLWMARKVERIEAMLRAILEGGKFALPKINDGMRTMELVIKAARNVGGQIAQNVKAKRVKKPKDKDLQPLPVPFDEVGFRQFCRELLGAVNASVRITDVKLTEAEWTKDRTREQFVSFRSRLEEKGVICVMNKRGDRGWRQNQDGSYAWALERLKKLAK